MRTSAKGQPDDIGGDKTPTGARINAGADPFDVMDSGLVYRPALPGKRILGVMGGASDTEIDLAIVEIFLRGHEEIVAPDEMKA